jgi:Ca-activated chloride channel family protein
VQVSAIGVGLDYDERTLGELARRSSGRMYHLEAPEQLAGILDQEVRLLSTTVATGAYLEISSAAGVQIEGAELGDGRLENGKLRVRLGALYAGQRRELLVKVKVGAASSGEVDLAGVKLVYQDRAAGGRWSEQSLAVRGALRADASAAAASVDTRVSAMLARHEAAEVQRRASEMVNKGQDQEAIVALEKSEEKVDEAAKRATDPNERARLTAQAQRMAQSRAKYKSADSAPKKRAAALESYGYSFSDDGLAPAIKAPPPPPPGTRIVK